MCGIAGINIHPSSKINVRELAHNLLSEIEYRGSHASGYAFVKGTDFGIHKSPIPGSQLPLTGLPRRAQTVILHTRFTTQGSQYDNRNNHPVLSPDGTVALVHNGVISNDYMFRDSRGGEFKNLPAVDTAVIPALIEKYGIDAVEDLEGYAAIAYLDLAAKDRDTLHLARLESSPVSFTWLTDGTFVFASTAGMLKDAIVKSGLTHGHIWTMPEEHYVTVRNGVITSLRDGIKMQEDWWVQKYYANSTSGGHGGSETGTKSAYTGIGSSFGGNVVFDDSDEDGDYTYEDDAAIRAGRKPRGVGRFVTSVRSDGSKVTTWEEDYRSKDVTFDPDEVAMAYADESNESPAEADDYWGFYIDLDDGTHEQFLDIEDMEKYLDWLSNMSLPDNTPFPGVEPKLKWTNFVIDLGEIRGNLSTKESWLENMARIDMHESPATYNLDYLRDGIASLIEASV